MQGGFGSDTYTFTSGDGLDTLTEGDPADPSVADPAGTDRIQFNATVNRSDVRLLRTESGELVISYGADDEITVAGQYNVGGDNIEEIDFTDGSTISKTELDALPLRQVRGAERNCAAMAGLAH